jgi:hypothetical protein
MTGYRQLLEAVCCLAALQVEAQVAAAAAAVADLSGRLLKANHQAQQSSWQSELAAVLQQQQSKLQAWAKAQVMRAVVMASSYPGQACAA